MCNDPEEQNRNDQRHGDCSGKSVGSSIVRMDSGRTSSVVFHERCSILGILLSKIVRFQP